MIPEPKYNYIETEHEFLIPMGKLRLVKFVESLPEDITIEDSRGHMSEIDRALQESITRHREHIALGDGVIIRNPTEEHKNLPFVICSLYEATVWTFISLTWGMDFAYKMLLSRYPIGQQHKWAECWWCHRDFIELAHPDSTICDGFCSFQCYDQEYDHRHHGQ